MCTYIICLCFSSFSSSQYSNENDQVGLVTETKLVVVRGERCQYQSFLFNTLCFTGVHTVYNAQYYMALYFILLHASTFLGCTDWTIFSKPTLLHCSDALHDVMKL